MFKSTSGHSMGSKHQCPRETESSWRCLLHADPRPNSVTPTVAAISLLLPEFPAIGWWEMEWDHGGTPSTLSEGGVTVYSGPRIQFTCVCCARVTKPNPDTFNYTPPKLVPLLWPRLVCFPTTCLHSLTHEKNRWDWASLLTEKPVHSGTPGSLGTTPGGSWDMYLPTHNLLPRLNCHHERFGIVLLEGYRYSVHSSLIKSPKNGQFVKMKKPSDHL